MCFCLSLRCIGCKVLVHFCRVVWAEVALLLLATFCIANSNNDNEYFVCGGKLEADIWQLWDSQVKEFIQNRQLQQRFLGRGDTYALYDVETYTHNLVAMAARCGRKDRINAFASIFAEPYKGLEAYPPNSGEYAWVCKGGEICNSRNRLLNREVLLTSVQYLGLVASVANFMVKEFNQKDDRYVEQTAIVAIKHLLRWDTEESRRLISKQLKATPVDVDDASPELLFTDKPLWMIAIYADLAGILLHEPHLFRAAGIKSSDKKEMSNHIIALLQLLSARITINNRWGRESDFYEVAELDRGFWRNHPDNRYASYEGPDSPVNCGKGTGNKASLNEEIYQLVKGPVPTLGWDLSHSRRLVHVLASIERNRFALQDVFGVLSENIPDSRIIKAFASQLTELVWNGDPKFPLFSNYWCGANGWYRVAYDNGRSHCVEGYSPFGLSESFTTGGYISWSEYIPMLGVLGRRLYIMSEDSTAESEFITQYYNRLVGPAGSITQKLMQIMFWPSLIVNYECCD